MSPQLSSLPGLDAESALYPDDPGRHPPGGRRYRCHRPRQLPAPPPEQVRRKGQKGFLPTRDRYRQLMRRAGPQLLAPKDRVVLELMVDQYEAGPGLEDVTQLRQRRIVEKIAQHFDHGEPWGYRLRTVQTIVARLAAGGWLSIEDLDLPGTGFQGNSYRFLIPPELAEVWREIILTSELAYGRVRRASREAERAAEQAEQDAAWQAYLEGTDEVPDELQDPLDELRRDPGVDESDELEQPGEDTEPEDPERAEEIRALILDSLTGADDQAQLEGHGEGDVADDGRPNAPP